jgi:hypothetical protein
VKQLDSPTKKTTPLSQPIVNMEDYVHKEVYENLKEKFLEKESEIDSRNLHIGNLEEQIESIYKE